MQINTESIGTSTYSHFVFQNSSLSFQSKTVREHLILLKNFVDQQFLLRILGLIFMFWFFLQRPFMCLSYSSICCSAIALRTEPFVWALFVLALWALQKSEWRRPIFSFIFLQKLWLEMKFIKKSEIEKRLKDEIKKAETWMSRPHIVKRFIMPFYLYFWKASSNSKEGLSKSSKEALSSFTTNSFAAFDSAAFSERVLGVATSLVGAT